MHRQSLGSPGSRNGAGAGGATELARPEKIRPAAATAASRRSRAVVHAIPIATLLCFLVLYLLSHDPALDSSSAGNGGGAESATKRAVSGIYIGRYIGGGGGGVSAARGLMEERRRRHRKDLPARHVRSS